MPRHTELVDRYPFAERARGFLVAVDLGLCNLGAQAPPGDAIAG